MGKAKILVIGAKGTVGTVICNGLHDTFDVIPFDLPEYDLENTDQLEKYLRVCDIVIYTAHAERGDKRENALSGYIEPKNIQYETKLLHLAVKHNVHRLICMSSVHADDFVSYTGSELLSIPGSYQSLSPYGAHKIFLEETCAEMCRLYDIEIITLRIGGVTTDNSVKTYGKEPQVWLSHSDLNHAIEKCINAETVPKNFSRFYVVSNNTGRIHDTSNPFGWAPQDNSADRLTKQK